MYNEERIRNKCYELDVELKAKQLTVKVFQNPPKNGYDIAIFDKVDNPAIREFFLGHTIAEVCLKKGECDAWKSLLLQGKKK